MKPGKTFSSILITSQCSLGSCVGVLHEVIMGVQWLLHLEVPGPHTDIKYIYFFLGSWMKILLRGRHWKRKNGDAGFSGWNSKLSVWWTEVDSHLTFSMPYSIWMIPLQNQTEKQLFNNWMWHEFEKIGLFIQMRNLKVIRRLF